MLLREAALKESANNKLRRLLAYDRSFDCADVKVGDLALPYKCVDLESAPRWRRPTAILRFGETGVTV